MQRFVRHAGRDSARFQRVAYLAAVERYALQRQEDADTCSSCNASSSSARGAGGRTHAGSVRETLRSSDRPARRRVAEEFGQPLELRAPDACVDVRQVELAAGKIDVARTVGAGSGCRGSAALRRARASPASLTTSAPPSMRGDVLVGVKAERHQVTERADVASTPARAQAPARRPRSRATRAAPPARTAHPCRPARPDNASE